jgi:hypothetical protein
MIRRFVAAAIISALALVPAVTQAASTFYGLTVHVSTQNIKVKDPHTGQTLSFLLLPKFDNVFSSDGKTTYQMSHVHAGQYVGIIYDQKALGQRHADKIYIMNNANQRIGQQ